MSVLKDTVKMFMLFLITSGVSQSQFFDDFNKKSIDGWFFFTGDGAATMNFVQMDGYARMLIDATKDTHNVYWTLIKRDVTAFLDLNKLRDPSYQLRVEARVRVHNAPRRVNFMVNTNRTVNFHIDLMEFEIPDTTDWHVISMTTKKFDALPGDTVYVQFCVTDYGLGQYAVDLDYYRADIVDVKLAGPDKGIRTPYHPPVPNVNTFSHHLPIAHAGLMNSDFPDVNFHDWHAKGSKGIERIVTVNATQWAIFRGDFEQYRNVDVDGAGVLELTTQSVAQGGDYIKAYGQGLGEEFGKLRIIEIIGGDAQWDQQTVTFNNFFQGHGYSDLFNTQMIIDGELSEDPGSKNFIPLSKPVMQRLLNGKTKGLLIRPLGSLDVSVYASDSPSDATGPKLHFNTKP